MAWRWVQEWPGDMSKRGLETGPIVAWRHVQTWPGDRSKRGLENPNPNQDRSRRQLNSSSKRDVWHEWAEGDLGMRLHGRSE